MGKYIDAEKIRAEIERRMENYNASIEKYYGKQKSIKAERDSWKWAECKWFLTLVTTLQQEQPEAQNGKFAFPKYLYARTKDNKTIDMSYAPQSLDAIEYIRNDFVEQEQPEVNLEKEIMRCVVDEDMNYDALCHHFYELGLNARKEE